MLQAVLALLFGGEYIKRERLPALKQYKYTGVDKSILSRYLLQFYWDRFIKVIPMFLAYLPRVPRSQHGVVRI